MTRTFVMLPEFDKQWANLGLTDKDLNRLQLELLENPQKGDVIQGTGGLRKLRFAFENRGKSGSARVAYVITVYQKNEKENLSQAERNNIKRVIEFLDKQLKGE